MTASHHSAEDAHWAVLGSALPESIAGIRVLDVSGDSAPDRSSMMLEELAPRELIRRAPGELEADLEGEFDLVFCRNSLQCDPHPMNLLTRLWHLARSGSVLLLESKAITTPEQSRYARFVTAAEAGGSSSYLLPGRLALRWMVEVSGYDVDCWLDRHAVEVDGPISVYLRATRADRTPALDLATPAPSK